LRYYEALFIVHPNYEQDRLISAVDTVENEILKRGGKMINKIDWGKRRLAYPIDKQKYGNYILFHFESEPGILSEFTRWMEIQSSILSQIIVKLEEKPEIIERDNLPEFDDDNVIVAREAEVKAADETESEAEQEEEAEDSAEAEAEESSEADGDSDSDDSSVEEE